MAQPIIALAGATGDLGTRITKALIARGASVHALTRADASEQKRQQTEALGATVAQADMSDITSVAAACEGAACVVSAEKVSLEEICAFIQKEFGVEISKSTARRYREGFKDWQLPPAPEPEPQIVDVPTTLEKQTPPEKPVTAKKSDERLQPESKTPLQESESATSFPLPEPKPPAESPARADTKKRAKQAISEKERIKRQQPTLFEASTNEQT